MLLFIKKIKIKPVWVKPGKNRTFMKKKMNIFPALIAMIILLLSNVANAQTSFQGDLGTQKLLNKALKHYGVAELEGDKVVFKKGRFVGFLVSDEDAKKALELAIEQALQNPDLIRNSRVKFRLSINQVTQCPWYKGEVFSSQYKGKHYTLLVCRR